MKQGLVEFWGDMYLVIVDEKDFGEDIYAVKLTDIQHGQESDPYKYEFFLKASKGFKDV